jgi:hypothetical protein
LFKFQPSDRQSRVSQIDLDNGKVIKPREVITAFLPDPRDMEMPSACLTMVWGKTRIPAVFTAELGKGKVMFMPLAIGSHVMQVELMTGRKLDFELDEPVAEAYRYLLADILKRANAGTWQCDAPAKVLTTLYKQDKSYYAHFLNGTGVNFPRGHVVVNTVPADGFPRIGQDITFTIFDSNVSVAEAASPDFENWQQLKTEKVEGGIKITLPENLLKVYTLVRVR